MNFNASVINTGNSSEPPSLPPQDPRTTEDCLFLDVVVPREVFKQRRRAKAPVLVWIHGGGYTGGSKDDSGSAAGLIARSGGDNNGRVIFVSFNYRLGAFGFLSGATLQADGVANAGLLDQRFALEWIQRNIHHFGGDPGRVTVVGESAGGGSIMHQITVRLTDSSLPKEPQLTAMKSGLRWSARTRSVPTGDTTESWLVASLAFAGGTHFPAVPRAVWCRHRAGAPTATDRETNPGQHHPSRFGFHLRHLHIRADSGWRVRARSAWQALAGG